MGDLICLGVRELSNLDERDFFAQACAIYGRTTAYSIAQPQPKTLTPYTPAPEDACCIFIAHSTFAHSWHFQQPQVLSRWVPLRHFRTSISYHCIVKSTPAPELLCAPIALHYLTHRVDIYIIACSLLAFLILACFGNLPVIDAFFFAVSANTESGLNTIDVKDLKISQQLVIYFFPIITNICFVNIFVVVIRLRCFEKRLDKAGESRRSPTLC